MKKFNYIHLLFTSTVLLASCDSFLDKDPDNRAELDSPLAVSQLLVSAYPDQTYQIFTESMSDNVSDRGAQANDLAANSPSRLLSEQAYFWENMVGDDQDTPSAYWQGCYAAIAATNHALEAIIKNGDGEEYSASKGEALLCRAYAHFMLVNIFAEHYNPSTAKTALGIPYVTKSEKVVFENYSRNSMEEVYANIIKDFNAGFPLIDDTKYTDKKHWHFTKKAAAAFASRLYLYMNQPDSVIKYANIVLGNQPQLMLRDWVGKYSNFSSSDAIAMQYDKSDENCNLLLIGCSSWLNRAIYNRYACDFTLMNTVGRGTNITGSKNVFPFYGWSDANGVFIPKYYEYFKLESINANFGLGYVMTPALTAEEVLLSRAEAYAMKSDFNNCLSDINSYYTTRIDSYSQFENIVTANKVVSFTATDKTAPAPFYSISADQLPYIKLLLSMRRSEFIHEGLRWFDIKRMHLTVTHGFYNNSSPAITLSGTDPRRAVQIPNDAMSFGILPNTRSAAPTPILIRD